MKKSHGFTLIELMTVLTIAAILLGIGVPSMRTFLVEQSLTSELSKLTSTLAFARAEAVSKSQQVVVCASADGLACSNATNWATGWIVFRDVNGNQAANLGTGQCLAAEDCLLRVEQAISNQNRLRSNAAFIAFDLQGSRTGASSTTFQLCSGESDWIRNLNMSAAGFGSQTKVAGVCPP